LILLGIFPLGGYNYITPRRAGLSATAGLSCPTYSSRISSVITEENYLNGAVLFLHCIILYSSKPMWPQARLCLCVVGGGGGG